MGQWTLLSATPDIRDRNDVYGHYFSVKFRLKYKPSFLGTFSEMPRLEWKEVITMIEWNKGTWWQHTVDQYVRDPNSQTFISWVSRYSAAHYAVRRSLYGPEDATCLYDIYGNRLQSESFPRLSDSKEQADYVRKYLSKHGGIMDVIVVDKPGINKNTDINTHKNRILTFDCGLKGCASRVIAYQHLIVDGSKAENAWHRKCELSAITPPYQTTGLRKVDAPDDVRIVKPFTGGAHKGTYL